MLTEPCRRSFRNHGALFAALACLLGAAQPAHAEWVFTSGTVIEVSAQSGGFWLQLEGKPNLCGDNESTGIVRVGLNPDGRGALTQSDVNQFLSIALAALMSGKKVGIFADKLEGWGCALGAIKLVAR